MIWTNKRLSFISMTEFSLPVKFWLFYAGLQLLATFRKPAFCFFVHMEAAEQHVNTTSDIFSSF